MAASESAGAEASDEVLDANREGYDGDTEKSGRPGGRRKGVESVVAAAAAAGGQRRGLEFVEGEESAADAVNGQNRDWPGTSSDAFEIAVAVLKVQLVCLDSDFFQGLGSQRNWV